MSPGAHLGDGDRSRVDGHRELLAEEVDERDEDDGGHRGPREITRCDGEPDQRTEYQAARARKIDG